MTTYRVQLTNGQSDTFIRVTLDRQPCVGEHWCDGWRVWHAEVVS